MTESDARASRRGAAVGPPPPRRRPSASSRPSGSRPRLDRSILWSGGLWLASFPLMLLFIAIVGMIASWTGVEYGAPEDAAAELALNLLYMALVLGVLAIAAVIGFRGWRRGGHRLALTAAWLSVGTAVLFVLAPALA